MRLNMFGAGRTRAPRYLTVPADRLFSSYTARSVSDIGAPQGIQPDPLSGLAAGISLLGHCLVERAGIEPARMNRPRIYSPVHFLLRVRSYTPHLQEPSPCCGPYGHHMQVILFGLGGNSSAVVIFSALSFHEGRNFIAFSRV